MSTLKGELLSFAKYCSINGTSFGSMPNDEGRLAQTEIAIKELIPKPKYTIEELDEANKQLDSRTQQYWHAYNVGYITALQKAEDALA